MDRMKKTLLTKGEKTRERLLEVSLKLFHRRAFHRVSLPEIAREVGISHPSLYEYFKDKEELLAECIELAIHRARSEVDSAIHMNMSAEEKLKAYVLANVKAGHHNRESVGHLLSLYFYASYQPRISKLCIEIARDSTARVESHILQGNREKVWRVSDSGGRARMIHDLLLGEVFKTHHDPEGYSEKKRGEMVWAAVVRILN